LLSEMSKSPDARVRAGAGRWVRTVRVSMKSLSVKKQPAADAGVDLEEVSLASLRTL
jgi:hypothetical protein